ncbi:dihydrolipoyl dehydrogenase family protein [Rhodalgimonas zhirmunskyi]|uniref:FAD-dependent oxidoreductase n=1 Tax=Rhodalgimonas zhirmunskyi TaxID=2964767 RepID=A0AAJ1UCU3_9RHOB|nr:FAD-dependent oxidoreductase [Rhodoalgimonas zhirmunskyi]MDQ2095608.1 FAD-dependent oxidoreductase [Rhodoalgimonas zhirmunskyi]
MENVKCDLLVIGAGSGGLSVASGAAQMGADVILLEGAEMGGDCLNSGCVPSKALLAAAARAASRAKGTDMGIAPATAEVDFAAVKDHVADVIAQIAPHDSVERFEGLGVKVITEYGRFTGPRTVEAGGQSITARRVVVATGSRPLVPPIDGLDRVPFETNETIFDLRERPKHLLILGGGPIGMEMAQAHRRLGCEVTVIEGQKALGRDDGEAAALVIEALRGEGVTIAEGAMAEAVSGKAGAIEVTSKDGRRFAGTHLLVALGRVPNLDRLDLDKAGIETARGGITVDARLRTSNKKVYAIGDIVAGGMQFTHVAGYHAGIVIRQAMFGLPAKASTAHIPWATYTDPELAQVGLTEAQAREEHGDKLEVLRADFAGNDRAVAERATAGFAKVMVVKGRPVGATIVGQGAGEQIGFWALALSQNMKISAVAGMVMPYPTRAEVHKRVAGTYFTPRLFDNKAVTWAVRTIQRWLP